MIGISGKIGSGKDTVGKIIQFLTAKDVSPNCEKLLKQKLSIDGYHNSPYVVKKFAGKLKEVATLLTGIPVEKFEDQEFKQQFLPEEWNRYRYLAHNGEVYHMGPKSDMPKYNINGFREDRMTVRELLQKLGTEAMRDGLHPDTWVNALMADYIGVYDIDTDRTTWPSWIITDTRFPNEAQSIHANGGIVIRVVRGNTDAGTHPSETALDDYPFDYIIENNGTFEELIEKVRKFCVEYKLIEK